MSYLLIFRNGSFLLGSQVYDPGRLTNRVHSSCKIPRSDLASLSWNLPRPCDRKGGSESPPWPEAVEPDVSGRNTTAKVYPAVDPVCRPKVLWLEQGHYPGTIPRGHFPGELPCRADIGPPPLISAESPIFPGVGGRYPEGRARAETEAPLVCLGLPPPPPRESHDNSSVSTDTKPIMP